MEKREPVGRSLEDELGDLNIEDYSIFENQGDVAENLKQSAEELGIPTTGIDKIKEGKPLEFLVAKKNSKQCWGKGVLNFVPNEPAHKRNTSLPEDRWERQNRVEKALCKCVRLQME